MSASFTAFALQGPTSGKAGGGNPVPEGASGTQHLKLAGPGHWFDTVLPLHDDVQRQFPLPEHWVLVQHLISLRVPGQALEMNVPRGRAFGCGDANARSILFACAGAVQDCTFGNCAAVHEGSAGDSCGCEEREIFHFKWDVTGEEWRFDSCLQELGSRLYGCCYTGDVAQRVMVFALYGRCLIMSGVLSSSSQSIERDLGFDSSLRIFGPNRE